VFWEFLTHSKQPTYLILCFVLIGSHQLVSEPGVFLLNSKNCLPKRTSFPQKKPDIRQHRKIKEQELGNSGFFVTNLSNNTLCNKRETTQRDGSTIGKHGAINEELIG
jgi:hypothetical protein